MTRRRRNPCSRSVAVAIACAALVIGCKSRKSPPDPEPDRGSSRPAAGADAAPAPSGTALVPLTWTIETVTGTSSRLFATIDAGVDVDAQMPPAIWDQVNASKTVALQWNLAEVTMPMLQRSSGALSTDLTADEKARLEAALGAPFVADLEKVKPSFVATVISAYGLPTTNPMQAVINQRAQDAGKPTVYLETGVVQQALLDRFLDVRAIKALIADLDDVKQGNATLLAAYVKGDLDALAGMEELRMPWKTAGLASVPEQEAMRKVTINDRHAAWVTFLRPLLDVGDAFIAVDVLDAIGPGGLVQQLRTAGYKVTRR